MAVPFAKFGSANEELYRDYLRTHYGHCGNFLVGGKGVCGGTLGIASGECGGVDRGCESGFATGYVATVCAFCQGGFDREWGGCNVGRPTVGNFRLGAVEATSDSGESGSSSGDVRVEGEIRCGDGAIGAVDGPIGSGPGKDVVDVDGGCRPGGKVGANLARNRANRAAQKARKLRKQGKAPSFVGMGSNWREQGAIGKGDGLKEKQVAPSGFWNSCSPEVRQQLIDSKAKMHIAENERRAQEDRKKVERMNSPEGLLMDAMRMIKTADEWAKRDTENKVVGWAKTVASDCAETIARSAPDSIKSYESFVASSASTVPLSQPGVQVVEKPVEVIVEKVVEKVVKEPVVPGTELEKCDAILHMLKTVKIDHHRRFPIVEAVNARKMKLELERIIA